MMHDSALRMDKFVKDCQCQVNLKQTVNLLHKLPKQRVYTRRKWHDTRILKNVGSQTVDDTHWLP